MGNICKNQTPCAAGANRKTLGTSSHNRHAFEGSCVEPATTDASLPPWQPRWECGVRRYDRPDLPIEVAGSGF